MFPVLMLVAAFLHVTLDEPHQMASGVKYSEAMCKTAVSCARINQLGETQLLNSAQALKRSRLNHLPHHMLELVCSEFY